MGSLCNLASCPLSKKPATDTHTVAHRVLVESEELMTTPLADSEHWDPTTNPIDTVRDLKRQTLRGGWSIYTGSHRSC